MQVHMWPLFGLLKAFEVRTPKFTPRQLQHLLLVKIIPYRRLRCIVATVTDVCPF